MPPRPRWRRQPAERPRQILDAALAEFADRGFAAARLDDIARRAGVAKGTIYLYFPDKDALFRGVVHELLITRIERGERDAGRVDESAVETLRRILRAYWEFIRSPNFAPLFRLVHAELPHYPDLARFYAEEVVARGQRLIADVIRTGVERGEFRAVDPRVAARMVVAPFVMHGVWCGHRELCSWMAGKSDAQLFRELMDFLHAAIAVPSAATPKRRRTPRERGASRRRVPSSISQRTRTP